MWIVLYGTVHKHVYTVHKQVLVMRRNWCTNMSKELRSETHYHRTTVIQPKYECSRKHKLSELQENYTPEYLNRFTP